MSKVLITGAAGFLGSRLVKRMTGEGFEVVGMDVVPRSGAWRLSKLAKEEGIDIEYKWGALQDIRSLDADYVIHGAAIADAPFAINSPSYTFQQNAMGTLALLEAAREQNNVQRIIIMSTEAVYGESPVIPIPEESILNPSNVYGASKAAEELLGLAYFNSYNVPVTIVRSCTMYGEGMRLDQVLPIFLSQAIKGAPITIHGKGDQTRDFNYVENVADGILLALCTDSAAGDTFNLASGNETSIRDLAERCIKATQSSSTIEHLSQRPGEEGVRLLLDDMHARKALGYKAKITFEEGLKRTATWVAETIKGTLGE